MGCSCCGVRMSGPECRVVTGWWTFLIICLLFRAVTGWFGSFVLENVMFWLITYRFFIRPLVGYCCCGTSSNNNNNHNVDDDGINHPRQQSQDERNVVVVSPESGNYLNFDTHNDTNDNNNNKDIPPEEAARLVLDYENPDELEGGNRAAGEDSPPTTTAPSANLSRAGTGRPRLHFLDNIKSFLTAIVVSHHASCAFGACGESWYLIVGMEGPKMLSEIMSVFVTINQAYFMSLFFFISAYFIPSSYEKKGLDTFIIGKRQRLWIPAIVCTFAIIPATFAVSRTVSDATPTIRYFPSPGPAWYIYWLLLLSWVYVSIQETAKRTTTEESAEGNTTMTTAGNSNNNNTNINHYETNEGPSPEPMKIPNTIARLGYGGIICGIAMLVVNVLSPGSFAFMPITIGSLTCDLFMFYGGILAKRHGWLEKPLREQLDIHPTWLFTIVIIEGTVMVASAILASEDNPEYYLLLFLAAGPFCIDMSLLLLLVFQEWMNIQTKFTHFFSRSAYAVYLIHPLIVCGLTAIYIQIYNQIVDDNDPIRFETDDDEDSVGIILVGKGGKNSYTIGWIALNICSQLLVWPVAYLLTQLPIVGNII